MIVKPNPIATPIQLRLNRFFRTMGWVLIVGETAMSSLLRVTIERVNAYGLGVARLNDKKYYIPFSLAGEEVLIHEVSAKVGVHVGEIVDIIKPSSHRAAPLCPHFGVCGGCQLQHIAYAEQLRLKQGWIREIFARFPDVEIRAIVPAPEPWHYRTRITIHHDGRIAGFYRRDSREIVPVTACPIANTAVNAELADINETVLDGPAEFEIRTDENLGFTQANTALNPALVEGVAAAARGRAGDRLLELYSGNGNFTFALASSAREVVAVEGNPTAAGFSERERVRRGFRNVSILNMEADEAIYRLNDDYQHFATVVCDPPRCGLKEALNPLKRLQPSRIVYVSCAPHTLARDAMELQKSGFRLASLAPYDMFPQTHHVETVAVFVLVGQGRIG